MNEITLYFDAPVHVALMRIANYSKTPARGVQARERRAEICAEIYAEMIRDRTRVVARRAISCISAFISAFIPRHLSLGV